MIDQELKAALADADKEHQSEVAPIGQNIRELVARLGQAHSGHLTAQQQLLDRDDRLAAAWKPTFGHFVSTAVKR
jgi:hypothetical protein